MKHINKIIRGMFWISGAFALYGVYATSLFNYPSLGWTGLAIMSTAWVGIWISLMPAYCIASVSDFIQMKPTRAQKIKVAIWSFVGAAICFAVALKVPISNQYYSKTALASSAALFGLICGLHWSATSMWGLVTFERDMETLRKVREQKAQVWRETHNKI